jgi:MYXO-CTERM domain-containing protein
MELQMRNKTFISSMVGVAAAAAVAGSANAGIPTGVSVFDFTTQVTSLSSGSVNGSNPFNTWGTDAGRNSTATSATALGGAITLATGSTARYTSGTTANSSPLLDFGVFSSSSFVNLTGMTALELNVTAYTPYTFGSYTAPSLVMNVIMFDDSINEGAGGQLIIDGTGKKSATITASAGFNWSKVTLIEIQSNNIPPLPSSGAGRSNTNWYTSYSFTFDSMVAVGAVPAPGALALLGAAGIVGARRRRA